MNLSFKRLCIIKKIEAFEKMTAGDPGLSVEAAAEKIGYGDPFYFSRLYKKIRLISPSAYIKSRRGRPPGATNSPPE
jgi:YesN/AraC family two-component response regulator